MLRYALIYGGIIGVVVIALMSLSLFGLGPDSAAATELAGYATMLVVLSLLFVGIKRYRDVEHGGVIRFSQGAAVGIGIAVVAGVIYAISWEVVLAVTDYSFIETYSQSMIDGVRASGLDPAAEAARIAEISQSMEAYRNPLFRLPITFIEIFPVGLIVALISALILKNPRVLPARAATGAGA